MLLQGWWQKVLEPQPVLVGTPAPRGTAAPCWWHRWLLRAQGWQQLSWGTRKQEVMAGKKAAPSSGDIDEVADGCGEECEWILVALRWLLLSGAQSTGDLLSLATGSPVPAGWCLCGDVTDMDRGHSSAPSLAILDPNIHRKGSQGPLHPLLGVKEEFPHG